MCQWQYPAFGLMLAAVAGCGVGLSPPQPGPPARLVAAAGGAAEPAEAPLPPVVRVAECRWATGKITLDGKLDEPAWKSAQPLRHFAVFWQKRKAKTATTARLLWDEKYLYFGADMEDSDVYALVKEHNGETWNDDVFELFFKPAADKNAYYEFQVNAANTPLEVFMPSRGSGAYTRFHTTSRLGLESAVLVQGTLNHWQDQDKGWTVEGRIPWSGFLATGGRPQKGARWRFALCRYDYSAEHERPELSSTAPLTGMDFHRYEDYSELTFVGPTE
jgi:hypothetical protein